RPSSARDEKRVRCGVGENVSPQHVLCNEKPKSLPNTFSSSLTRHVRTKRMWRHRDVALNLSLKVRSHRCLRAHPMMSLSRSSGHVRWALWLGMAAWPTAIAAAAERSPCVRTISAHVVALDQPLTLNRLGASVPGGMIFALAEDVVPCDPTDTGGTLQPGKVMLRTGKRPRPPVLRMNVGDCLQITFTH